MDYTVKNSSFGIGAEILFLLHDKPGLLLPRLSVFLCKWELIITSNYWAYYKNWKRK